MGAGGASPRANKTPSGAWVKTTGVPHSRESCRLKVMLLRASLTAVSVGLLTIYDMCKAADRGMRITDVRLLHKAGGKSGTFTAADVSGGP